MLLKNALIEVAMAHYQVRKLAIYIKHFCFKEAVDLAPVSDQRGSVREVYDIRCHALLVQTS
jgi:hypothetical protein